VRVSGFAGDYRITAEGLYAPFSLTARADLVSLELRLSTNA
jgi:hypothetical protein